MAKKLLWFLVSGLMVISLLIASCGNGGADETPKSEYADPLVPKYGGTFTRLRSADINNFDYGGGRDMFTISLMGEELLMGDWARGPAGTNENDWTGGFAGFISMLTGKLAERWEMPDDETLVYHIRPGIKWGDKAPANGRELTADDVVWNINRHFEAPLSYLYNSYTTVGKAPVSATALDKYTVEVKVLPEWQGLMATVVGDFVWLLCPDVIEANNGEPMKEWSQFIGTGPYMIDDYVTGSYVTYVKNQNYWQMDPLNPKNRLPYVEGMKELIITDTSSQQAAFRTGQLDHIALTNWEDVELMKSQHPELQMKTSPASSINLIWPRLDNEELPFSDIRVRYAMNLAVNQKEILEDYYGGYADILGWPYPNLPVFSNVFTPLEEQSQIVQDLFGYDPERAKTLLAEAGYPNGFKFTVDCASLHSDYLSIVREYLADVGITMELSNLEWSVYMSVWMGGTYKDALWANDYVGNAYRMMCMSSASIWNYSRWNHPKTEAAVQQISQYLGKDDTMVAKVMKDIGPWELEQAVPIYLPSPYSFTLWWPWLQNFYGATGGGGYSNLDEYIMYLWIDTDMKAKMGY